MPVLDAPPVELDHPVDYHDEIAARADRVRVLIIPERRYLLIDGTGGPGEERYTSAIGSLYPVAYALHFILKGRSIEEPIGSLEANSERATEIDEWTWRLQLPVPHAAADEDIDAAIEQVRGGTGVARLDDVRCEKWQEGLVAQILHIGPYDDQQDVTERLQAAIAERGLRPRGRHHEIYISDPDRTPPERLKTVIRQPVEWA